MLGSCPEAPLQRPMLKIRLPSLQCARGSRRKLAGSSPCKCRDSRSPAPHAKPATPALALHPRSRSIPPLPQWLCWAWTDSPTPLQPHMPAQIPAHTASLARKPWATAQDCSSAMGQPSPSHPAGWWEPPLTARALQAEQLTTVVWGEAVCTHTEREW